VKRLDNQLERVVGLAPDVVCLQEVTAGTAEIWRPRLAEAGWAHQWLGEPHPHSRRRRHLSVLTASRTAGAKIPVAGLPWPERVVAGLVGGVEYLNVHSPISPSPQLAKIRTHEAVFAHLASGHGPRVLCGDLNTPRREHLDGRIWTFARSQHGVLRADRGDRWDEAELALIHGLGEHGFRDAYRAARGLSAREISWKWPRWEGGYRLDHLIVSSELEVLEVGYLHNWRTDGLSDHSALFARLARRPPEHAPIRR
jgi:endonuclease/exonuclease/phosphatase family metal-dependent hydrolase